MTVRRTPERTLTVQELESSHLARFDLGPGYPQTEVPAFIRDLYLDDTIEELSLRFAPRWSLGEQRNVNRHLARQVLRFLKISDREDLAVSTTFSGSIALDRAISAVQRQARERHFERVLVVTTTPCIDIMHLFLGERAEVSPRFVESRASGRTGELDLEGILAAIDEAAKDPRAHTLVMLTSPENPTGETWSEGALRQIALSCAANDATLLVDHCFLVAGVHETGAVSAVWDLDVAGLSWIGVWDTGKTFGLNEDKLGFILTGTKELTRSVGEAVSVLQFDVARRQRLFFTELLKRADECDYVRSLREVCRTNLALLQERLHAQSDITVRIPTAGSLALLDLAASGWSDEAARKHLLSDGVGVVAGNVFFHTGWRPDRYLRVALARDRRHFEDSINALVGCLQRLRP